MRPGEEWDSVRATEAGRLDLFLRALPNFSLDPARSNGNNALVLRAQMLALGGGGVGREYAAVNVGRGGAAGDAGAGAGAGAAGATGAAALAHDLLVHAFWRSDPVRAGAGGLKLRFGQTFKQGGRFADAAAAGGAGDKVFSAGAWPFRADRPFFLRLVLDARGAFSYVDGRFVRYTPFPGLAPPAEGETLLLQLPNFGDAGEKPTWRVLSAHWGAARVDREGDAAHADFARSPAGAAAAAAARVESATELYVTGVPPGASDAALLDAFRAWGAVAARRDAGEGAGAGAAGAAGAGRGTARVTLGPGARPIAAVVAETNGRVSVAGAVVGVRRLLVRAAAAAEGGGAAAAGTGGGGGGGASSYGGRSPPGPPA